MNAYSYIELPADAFFFANGRPGVIDLGTCVRIDPRSGRSGTGLTEEGVVIEIVDPGQPVLTAGLTDCRNARPRVRTRRYVVESGGGRHVRRGRAMEVDAL